MILWPSFKTHQVISRPTMLLSRPLILESYRYLCDIRQLMLFQHIRKLPTQASPKEQF